MLLLFGSILFPQISLAAEVEMPNEIQTNLNIQSKILLAYEKQTIPFNFDGYQPVKTQEEIERDAKLARFADKLAKANLPKGKFTINASAYTAAADECGKSDGITASGVLVKENRTIACPGWMPFGAKLDIEGMGVYTCEDRGGAIKANHIDIYMQTKKQAFAFGRQNLTAEFVR
jgi:3D (Asp-Asp-Asp) domain-containing protein